MGRVDQVGRGELISGKERSASAVAGSRFKGLLKGGHGRFGMRINKRPRRVPGRLCAIPICMTADAL